MGLGVPRGKEILHRPRGPSAGSPLGGQSWRRPRPRLKALRQLEGGPIQRRQTKGTQVYLHGVGYPSQEGPAQGVPMSGQQAGSVRGPFPAQAWKPQRDPASAPGAAGGVRISFRGWSGVLSVCTAPSWEAAAPIVDVASSPSWLPPVERTEAGGGGGGSGRG